MQASIRPYTQIVIIRLFMQHPPTLEKEVWGFQKSNIILIRKAMDEFNWERAFFNVDINEMVSVCNATIKKTMANFIPHKTIICDDRDPP